MLTVLLLLLGLFTAGYLILLGSFIKGWKRLEPFNDPSISQSSHFFSIVIPARNEENNIGQCLQCLLKQEYPLDKWEIIVVDDHSEDETAAFVKEFILEHKKSAPEIRLVQMSLLGPESSFAYKKQALQAGISVAKGDWIITTDADTERGGKWLSTISDFIENKNPFFVSAPVAYHNEKNLFGKLQSLEFLSLIGIGGASLSNGNPNMCNGANLGFSRNAFETVGGYRDISKLASGDDEFLMHKMFNAFPNKVLFLKNYEATVFTKPEKNVAGFLFQRKRWVSKSTHYGNRSITAILAAAYIYHLLLLISVPLCFYAPRLVPFFLVLLFLKIMSEFFFLALVASFFKRKNLLILFLPATVLYIFYVVFIGIYGNIGSYTWKGRKVK